MFATLQRQRGDAFAFVRGIEARHHGGQFHGKRFHLDPIELHHPCEFRRLRIDLFHVGPLALAQLARVLDALFDPRHLGARLVVAALNRVQSFGLGGLVGANALDVRLRLAQIRDHRLHRRLAARSGGVAHAGFQIEALQAQRQQLGEQLALFFLQGLIAARRGRLALQVANLLFHFLAQIVQPIQVLAGVGDAALGFAAPLLVARDARCFLQEGAQVVGPCLDNPRNHALLDDGVAARSQTGAEEQLRDVLAPHLEAIDEIIGGAVAAHRTPQRDLVVVRVRAADLAVGIVEDQFHRSIAQGFARRRSVENDVGHRFAAQMFGGNLAHDPAHRIDDVGFAAAVGPDHARQAAGKCHRRRIDE